MSLLRTQTLLLLASLPSLVLAAPQDPRLAPYAREISGTGLKLEMVPIKAGTFTIGSPRTEKKRKRDEGPQRKVAIDAFWMGKYEVTWELYEQWAYSLEKRARKTEPTERDKAADAVTRPTPPYTDMTFSMGREGFPAICMTQLAAKTFCKWLSAKTGEYYRLPTEAEWEYACRAGTTTAWSFGDDKKQLDDYAWFSKNSKGRYHKVGGKKPNPWGLYDMHGNVAEWCLDQYAVGWSKLKDGARNPFAKPTELYPRVVRGGNWRHRDTLSRSAARVASSEQWKMQDPQFPQSIWYHTDALYVGFRVVRPLAPPTDEQRKQFE